MFEYPDSGKLVIDVHIRGNPDPNRVTLWKRQGETTNSVPISSQDFQWTFERVLESVAGVIQITISDNMVPGSFGNYALKAENGVIEDSKFQYIFAVKYPIGKSRYC